MLIIFAQLKHLAIFANVFVKRTKKMIKMLTSLTLSYDFKLSRYV